MSISNPFDPNWGWKVDPDHRQNRCSGPVTTYKLTPEEIAKQYGSLKPLEYRTLVPNINGNQVKQIREREREAKAMGEVVSEVKVETGKEVAAQVLKLTKAEVKRLKDEGKSMDEIAEMFLPGWNGKEQLLKAKISLFMSDKKLGGPKKATKLGEKDLSQINSHEEHPDGAEEAADIKVLAEAIKKDFDENAKENARQIGMNAAKEVDLMMEMAPDEVNHPKHYTDGKYEVIDFIQDKLTPEEFEGFCKGVILQYICRSRLKEGFQDLRKAQWYLNKLVSVKESQGYC